MTRSIDHAGCTVPGNGRLEKAHSYLCNTVPAMAVLVFFAWCYVTVRPYFDPDDANPEILNSAWALANGDDIYRGIDSPPYSFAIYTPIYVAIVAVSMKLFGLSFIPAKMITLVCSLLIGLAIVHLSRLWRNTARDGIWTAFLCLLVPAILYNVIRSHPQMMAVALSIWSLVFFLKNRWFPTLVVSPLLAVLAFYTKQSQVALPIALVLYLALHNRKWLLPYASVGAVAGLVPFFWLQHITNGSFFINAFLLSRLSYDLRNIALPLLHWAGPVVFFFVIAVVSLWKRFRDRHWEPMDFYFALLIPLSVLSLGRVGSHSQYVVELIIVTLLYLLYTRGLPRMKGREAIVALQVCAILCYAPAFILIEEAPWDLASIHSAERIYPMIQKEPGPILSKQGSFALFSRGSIYIQLFHFGGMRNAGMWDERPLLRDIDRRKFSWVITQFPIEHPGAAKMDVERFSPGIISSLRENYRIHEAIYPYYLYSRRPNQLAGFVRAEPAVSRAAAAGVSPRSKRIGR